VAVALSTFEPRFRRVWWLIKTTWHSTWLDDVPFYAAGIAFHSLFSIFSLLFLSSLLLGLFGTDPDNLRGLGIFLGRLTPDEAGEFIDTVLDVVSRPVPTGLIGVAILFTLWTSSNVFQALIHALNRIYHVRGDARAAWRTRLIALAVVGSSSLLFVVGFILIVLGKDLSGGYVEMPWRNRLLALILAAREPLSVITVFLAGLLLYWLAPKFKHAHRISWPGALVFTAAWTVTTFGFNVYLRDVAVYDRVYGPLATLVVVLVWVYLSAFWCLVGGEVNAAIRKMRLLDQSGF
jgi:membrane protein